MVYMNFIFGSYSCFIQIMVHHVGTCTISLHAIMQLSTHTAFACIFSCIFCLWLALFYSHLSPQIMFYWI
ncbi:hypothetical protein VNO80_18686 [Phaseolus coccineus]|uniref:Uncharacterized protein n=1 Tax=Phaseolus coccineus TaxID=3886 RepID=A0AAN9MEL3_PHACN